MGWLKDRDEAGLGDGVRRRGRRKKRKWKRRELAAGDVM